MSDSVWSQRRQPTRLSIAGILQARTVEWVAISFSNAWKWKVKVKSLCRVRLFVTPWTAAHQAPPSMGFSRQEYWSGVPSPSPLLHCRWILYQLIYKGSPGPQESAWISGDSNQSLSRTDDSFGSSSQNYSCEFQDSKNFLVQMC